MTMVVACNFKDGAVIIADSRITWESGGSQLYQDTLQKILPLSSDIFISYAGNVRAAEIIVKQLRNRIHKRPRLQFLKKLAAEVPRIARHYFSLQQFGSLSLILGGINKSGNPEIWWFESPTFTYNRLEKHYKAIGSGRAVSRYLESKYH